MLELIGTMLAFLYIYLVSIWEGWILKVLWGWYIVPQFNLKPLTVYEAIGISLIAGVIQFKRYRKSNDTIHELKNLGFQFLSPFLSLIFGWIIHLLMIS